MNNPDNSHQRYTEWLSDWKERIQSAQIKAALAVNRELLLIYWYLGYDISEAQKTTSWGEGLIPRFARDLKAAFPHLTGFSRTNLFYIRKWYLFYQEFNSIVPQAAGQLKALTTLSILRALMCCNCGLGIK
jgi:DUF1016 N-terminal domain